MGYLATVLAFLMVAMSAYSQNALELGTRVKIDYRTETSRRYLIFYTERETITLSAVGTVDSLTADSVFLCHGPDAALFGVSKAKINYVYHSTGIRRNTWKGLWKGAAVGGLLGCLVMAGPTAEREPDTLQDYDDLPTLNERLRGAALLLGSGAIIGTVVGYLSSSEQWERVWFEITPVVPLDSSPPSLSFRIHAQF